MRSNQRVRFAWACLAEREARARIPAQVEEILNPFENIKDETKISKIKQNQLVKMAL